MGGACTALRDRAADAFGSPKRGHAAPPENLSSGESPRAEARAEGGAPRAALFAPPPTPVTSSAENSLSVSASGGLLLPTAAAAAKKGEESSVGEAAAHAPVVFKGAGVPVKVGEESVEGAADKEAAEDSFSGDTHPLAHGDDDDDDVTGTWYESGEEGDDASKAGGGGPSAGPAPSHLVTSHARPFDADAPPAAAAARLVHSRVEAFRRPAEPASPPPVPPPPKPTFEHSPSSLSALQSAKKHGTWPPPPPPPPHPGLVPQPASGAFGSPVDASTVPAAPPSGDAEENYVTPAPSVPSSVAGSSDHRASGGSSDSSPAAAKVKMSSSDIATAAAAAVASGLPGSTLLRGEPLGGSDAARSLALESACRARNFCDVLLLNTTNSLFLSLSQWRTARCQTRARRSTSLRKHARAPCRAPRRRPRRRSARRVAASCPSRCSRSRPKCSTTAKRAATGWTAACRWAPSSRWAAAAGPAAGRLRSSAAGRACERGKGYGTMWWEGARGHRDAGNTQ